MCNFFSNNVDVPHEYLNGIINYNSLRRKSIAIAKILPYKQKFKLEYKSEILISHQLPMYNFPLTRFIFYYLSTCFCCAILCLRSGRASNVITIFLSYYLTANTERWRILNIDLSVRVILSLRVNLTSRYV